MPLGTNLLMQAYWLSIFLIGVCLLYFLQHFKKFDKLQKLPLIGKVALSGALGYIVFAPCALLGYLFTMPPWWMAAWYLLLLVSSVGIVVWRRKSIAADLKSLARWLKGRKLFSVFTLSLIILLVIIAANFLTGGFLDGDGVFHIGKARHLATDGMTLTDFFYGTIIETSHSVTIIHILYAIPVVFGFDAIDSYTAALPFFNIISWLFYGWLTLYLVEKIKVALKPESKTSLALAITVFIAVITNSFFATYPSFMATAFLILAIIGILEYVNNKNSLPLYIAAIGLTFSHALYAIIAILLIGLIYVGLLLFSKERIKFLRSTIIVICSALFCLAIGPIITFALQKMTGYTPDNMLEYGTSEHWDLGGLYAMRPYLDNFFMVGPMPLIALSVIGLVTLFIKIKDRTPRVVAGCLLLFLPLTIWNPVVYPLMDGLVPEWIFSRFFSAVFLPKIAVGFGVLGIVLLANGLLAKLPGHLSRFIKIELAAVIVLCVAATNLVIAQPILKTTVYGSENLMIGIQHGAYRNLIALRDNIPQAEDTVFLTTATYQSFPLVAATNTNVRIFAAKPTSTPGDSVQRNECMKYLNENWNLSVMKQLGIGYILALPGSQLDLNAQADPDHVQPVEMPTLDYSNLYRLETSGVEPKTEQVCTFKE
jgi:hypothetical protein